MNLRAARPSYKLNLKVSGLEWQSGSLNAQLTADTSGTGTQLLGNLKAEGTLTGAALDFGTPLPWRCVSGAFTLAWAGAASRLRLTTLNLRSGEDVYTGQGSTQESGRLLLTLNNGLKEVRIAGPPGLLKVEELVAR